MKTADELAVEAAEQRFGKSDGAGGMPTSQMGSEGGLSSKAGGKAMTKAKVEEKEEEEGDEDEGEEEEEKLEKKKSCKKSEAETVSEDDLTKSMDALEAIAGGDTQEADRRAELGVKMSEGTLSKSERDELVTLLGGETESDDDDSGDEEGETFGKSFEEVFAEDEELAESYDVSPLLEHQANLIAKSLDSIHVSLRDELHKSVSGQQQFNSALAKSFRNVGTLIVQQADMIKSLETQNGALAERLGIVESRPRARKGFVGSPEQLKKSFGSQENQSAAGEGPYDGLQQQEVMDGLHSLMQKSRDRGFIAPCGEPIDRAVSMLEGSGHISRSMLTDVKAVING